jgi:mono/diheme cytochrome c family protein
MKKLFKILGIILLLVVIIVAGGATFISVRGLPSYDVNVPEVPKIEVTPERVARGEKIAGMLCKNCHYNPQTGKLTGRELTEAPAFGKIYSKNITNDKESGIGKWTDAEIIYLIRTGIHPHTGKYIPPYMAKLMHISHEDLNSVIAFLRSDNPLVQADPSVQPATEPSFLTKFLCMVAFKPLPYPDHEIPNPDTADKVAWGKYLTLYQLECFTCHSADFKTMNVAEPEKSEGFFGGGNVLSTGPNSTITTLNITPDEETGIGKWTEEEFVKAVKSGIVPNGPALRPPMQPYVQLTDEEAKAIYAYLRTVPKINHKVDRGI